VNVPPGTSQIWLGDDAAANDVPVISPAGHQRGCLTDLTPVGHHPALRMLEFQPNDSVEEA
jgi:hypothetical protein